MPAHARQADVDVDEDKEHKGGENPLFVQGRIASIAFIGLILLLVGAFAFHNPGAPSGLQRPTPHLTRFPDHSHHQTSHAQSDDDDVAAPDTTDEPAKGVEGDGHDMAKMHQQEASLGGLSHAEHQQCPLRTYFLQGEPKSGTTWLEIVVDKLLDSATAACAHRPGTPCKQQEVKLNRVMKHANLTCGPYRFDDIEFVRNEKHNLPTGDGFFRLESTQLDNVQHLHEHGCLDDLIASGWEKHACPTMASPEDTPLMRYIVIFRDPRANVVSAYHYFGNTNDINTYARQKIVGIAERIAFRYHWFTHMIPAANRLILFYEDMIARPLREYERIADFMCLGLSRDNVLQTVNETSFQAMQQMEKNHELPRINRPGSEMAKVRSGEAEAFRNELSAETVAFMDKEMKRIMQPSFLARLGLK